MSKKDFLFNWSELDGYGTILDKEWGWLHLETGLDKQMHDLRYAWMKNQGYNSYWDMFADQPGSPKETDWYADAASLTFSALTPRLDGTIDAEPTRGAGSATFTRADGATDIAHVRDFENLYKKVPADEARFQGARRATNHVLQSEDLTHASWIKTTLTVTDGVAAPDGTLTAFTLKANGASSTIRQTVDFSSFGPDGSVEITSSVWIRRRSGSGTIRYFTTAVTSQDITISTEWQRFSHNGFNRALDGISDILLEIVTSGDEIDVWHPQIEMVSGQTIQAPSEYVPTTTSDATKYFWKTNGNTVASNVVTEADGDPLHPTSYKLGAKVFDRYNKWQASTAYSVGDRIIAATGSGPAGGDGYYYECTVAGTSGGSEPTFDTTIGNTTADNTVTWENKGRYTVAGYLAEPARTNSITDSYDLTAWTQTGTAVSALDAVGIDGVANHATTLTDDDGAAYEYVDTTVTIPNDSNTHTYSVYFKKDADTSRFPAILLFYTGGTQQSTHININTSTGALHDAGTTGTNNYWTEDRGDWWKVNVSLDNNTTGNVSAQIRIYPAVDTVFITGGNVAATGSCIVGHAQLELNTSVPSSPILTTGAADTRAHDSLSYTGFSNDYSDDEGTALASIFIPTGWHGAFASHPNLLSNNSTRKLIGLLSTNASPYIYDGTAGTSTHTASAEDSSRIVGSRWSNTVDEIQAAGGGTSASVNTYDQDFGITTLYVGEGGEGGDASDSIIYISDVLVYNKDLDTTKLEAMTAYD